jgi:hypothetical protein
VLEFSILIRSDSDATGADEDEDATPSPPPRHRHQQQLVTRELFPAGAAALGRARLLPRRPIAATGADRQQQQAPGHETNPSPRRRSAVVCSRAMTRIDLNTVEEEDEAEAEALPFLVAVAG